MKVKIRETNCIEELSMQHNGIGKDWAEDLIARIGAFKDGSFEYDHADNIYIVCQKIYDWWKNYFIKMQQLHLKRI